MSGQCFVFLGGFFFPDITSEWKGRIGKELQISPVMDKYFRGDLMLNLSALPSAKSCLNITFKWLLG